MTMRLATHFEFYLLWCYLDTFILIQWDTNRVRVSARLHKMKIVVATTPHGCTTLRSLFASLEINQAIMTDHSIFQVC